MNIFGGFRVIEEIGRREKVPREEETKGYREGDEEEKKDCSERRKEWKWM